MDTPANYDSTMAGETTDHKKVYTEGFNPTYAAAVTHDPVNLAPNINRSPDARRFRDLLVYYRERLGSKNIAREEIRVQVLTLITLTIQLERVVAGTFAGKAGKLQKKYQGGAPLTTNFVFLRDDPHGVIHVSAQIQGLLKSLGLLDTALQAESSGRAAWLFSD